MDSVVFLLAEENTADDYGVIRKGDPSKRKRYCKVDSVSGREVFDGGRAGLNPEYRVTMFHGDYKGERSLLLDGKPYAIYRHYRDGDYIELYVTRKGGTNGLENR